MKDFFKMDVTKEELDFLTEQLESFRKKKEKEKAIKEIKERIRNDINKLWEFIMPCDYEIAEFLEDVVRNDLDLGYKWIEY